MLGLITDFASVRAGLIIEFASVRDGLIIGFFRLSQEDVDAPALNAFKGHLERRRRHQMDFFKDI